MNRRQIYLKFTNMNLIQQSMSQLIFQMSYQSSRLIENLIDDQSSYNSELNHQTEGNETVEMLIQLDSDRSATLNIGPYDDPVGLARKFCYCHNVDPKVIQTLAANIKEIQNSSFKSEPIYEKLIRKQEKENKGYMSNLNGSVLGKSKCSQKKHNTTFNEDTTLFDNNQSTTNAKRKSVFDRLYQQSKTKRKINEKEEIEEKSRMLNDTKSYLNSSQVKLYQKNTRLREETMRKNEELKMRYELEKEQEFTHHPKINPISDLIVSKIRGSDDGLLTSKSQQKLINKTINYLRQKERKQLQECTFHPEIISKNKNEKTSIQRYLLLHEDHLLREKKAQEMKEHIRQIEDHQRYPEINGISKKIVEGKSFYQRLDEYQSKLESKKLKNSQQRLEQTRRRPSTGRKPLNRNPSGQKIGDYLYNQASKKKRSSSVKDLKNYTNKKSQKLYEQSKKNAFRYLFTLMDNDEDGLISSLKINIIDLDPEILQLLSPLLCQMEEIQVELDEEEFIDSLERLFTTFSVHEKNLILNVYKNPKRKDRKKEEHSFHPSLNDKSIELAREMREPGISLYEMGREKAIEKEQRMSELKALKALMEYEECTFHPNLFHNHN